MKRIFAAAVVAAVLAAAPALAQQAAGQKQMSAQEFFKDAAAGGLAEVALGKLGIDNAQSQQVRGFAEGVVNDHAKANAQLMGIGKKMNMSMPNALEPKHQQAMDKLQSQKGQAFDQAFMQQMVKDHQEDVAKFQSYAQTGDNADLKQFAQTTLPVLQQHLRMAQDLQQGTEKAEAGGKKSPSGATTR